MSFLLIPRPGSEFQRLIPEDGVAAQRPEEVKRLIFCTGKVYYELTKERKNREMDATVAIARIEQVRRLLFERISTEPFSGLGANVAKRFSA